MTGRVIVDGPLGAMPDRRSILPASAYTDPAVLAAEHERIFAAGWVWAGYEHWLPGPGAVHPVTVAGRPLLLVRDGDGALRAFHNSCRHRGMSLVEEPTTVVRRMRCTYHGWSFGLDGSLAGAPYYRRQLQGQVEPEAACLLGLLPVAVATWAGMVFVHLGGRPEPLETFLAALLARWDHVDLGRLRLAEERRFDITANWKLVVENFLDFYHLPFVHSQVGPPASSIEVDDVVLAEHVLGGCYPHGAAAKAKKHGGALTTFGDVPPDRLAAQDIFCVFPNALVFLQADWFQVIAFQPVAPDRTLEHMAVFVDAGSAGPEHAAARSALCDVLFHVNEQDAAILPALQAGKASPGADTLNLVSHWDQVAARFQQLVGHRLEGGTP